MSKNTSIYSNHLGFREFSIWSSNLSDQLIDDELFIAVFIGGLGTILYNHIIDIQLYDYKVIAKRSWSNKTITPYL